MKAKQLHSVTSKKVNVVLLQNVTGLLQSYGERLLQMLQNLTLKMRVVTV